ncbi:MAG: sensor histidine kinase [Bacteroidetes bacterium]|nr:sensor histidine kinase [Bacteroidota bacterium]
MRDFLLVLLLSVIIILVFALALSYKKKLNTLRNEIKIYRKELTLLANHSAELERERIAKNLHDDIGMTLSLIKLHLTKISRNQHDQFLSNELIEECVRLVEQSIDNLRMITNDLMPPTLIKSGYEKGVAELCRQLNVSDELSIYFTKGEKEIRLSQLIELYAYRILQEVLLNIIKHSGAKEISVFVNSDPDTVTTAIKHNGTAVSTEKINELTDLKKGLGLRSLQDRLEMINASIIYSAASHESQIIITIPVYEGKN